MRRSPLPFLTLLLTPGLVHAAPVNVATAAEFIAAIQKAKAGDEILLADGTYAIKQNLSCTADGAEGSPIVVRAANPLGATILFDAVEGFKVSGKRWRFEGLLIRGVCASDSTCEHAFHVTGDADDFAMVGCTVRDFNAQLKVNASKGSDGAWYTPDRGLIEGCDLGDDKPRQTSNPAAPALASLLAAAAPGPSSAPPPSTPASRAASSTRTACCATTSSRAAPTSGSTSTAPRIPGCSTTPWSPPPASTSASVPPAERPTGTSWPGRSATATAPPTRPRPTSPRSPPPAS
jgi:hypothetical protein